ncbi:MAG: XdhC family protein [Acidobacteriota bacterium]
MSDWVPLARALRAACDRNERVALATLVATEGSAYRRAGAWMLVSENGVRHGLLSGGCLEADVAERAGAAMARGASELATYATGDSDDLVWGLRMGCPGVVRILIEPLAGGDLAQAAAFFERVRDVPENATLATALPPARGRLLVTSSDALASSPGVGLPPGAAEEGRKRSSGLTATSGVETIDGVELAFAPVSPRIRLLICGAGDDALPVSALAAELGWDVLVADHRPAAARPERFPGARAVLVSRAEEILTHVSGDSARPGDNARTAAVVMTHNVDRDVEWAAALLPLDLAYLGFLGPKRRGDQVLETARPLAAAVRARHILSPAGLDIGSETPREIALSIVAEISAALSGRGGGPLAERRAPIHEPVSEVAGPARPPRL